MVTVTKYVWDLVFDGVSHELDENNAVKAVYNNEPQQYGGVLSQRRGTTSHYHHHDALGSTRFLTDSSGNVTDTYLNDAWGNPIASSGTTVNPFRWVGRYGYYQDASTGLVYVRARMYQPTVARWCSIDPQGFVDGNNLYSVSWNGPTSHIDPSGMRVVHTGISVCNARISGDILFGASDLQHRFLMIDGIGYGYFEKDLNVIGSGDVRNDDLNTYPVYKFPNKPEKGQPYSYCNEITMNDDCWDPTLFKKGMLDFIAKIAALQNDTYSAGYWDCFKFAEAAELAGAKASHKPGAPCWCWIAYAAEFDNHLPWWVTSIMAW